MKPARDSEQERSSMTMAADSTGSSAVPISPHPATAVSLEEHMMIFNEQISISSAGQLLEQAAARMGLTTLQMAELLESDLNVDELLTYIDAVVTNRMN
jgi:hypothetical protein